MRYNQRNRSQRNYTHVWKRDKETCQYCGYPGECIDHIIPYIAGGNNHPNNLVVSCRKCNGHAHALIFPSFEHKREYLIKKRRAEMDKLIVGIDIQCKEDECVSLAWCKRHSLCWAGQEG